LLSQNEIILFVASLWSIWKRLQLARDVIHNWQAVRIARQQQQTRANLQLSNDGNGAGIGLELVQEQQQ
jgi:hypothetical protein